MTGDVRYRPLPIRLANCVGSLAASAGWTKRNLDPDCLLDLACRRTVLDDFGLEDFLEPFRLLVRCYNTEARLNFIGRLSAKTYLLQLLQDPWPCMLRAIDSLGFNPIQA